jgi:hypothetical protein
MRKNRKGTTTNFPYDGSVAGVSWPAGRHFLNAAEVADFATVLKIQCMLIWKSCYFIDSAENTAPSSQGIRDAKSSEAPL